MSLPRLALVTGSSRGIGASIAKNLARDGFHVAVNHHNVGTEEGRSVVEEIRNSGGSASICPFDVSDLASTQRSVGALCAEYGDIHVLVNNAGIVRDRSFKKMAVSEWNDVLSVNLNGVMHVTSAVLPKMLQRKFGRIINISSFVAQAGNFGQTNYAAAKAAIIGFTRSLALEVATANVTVNCVCPGFIDTQMWRSIPEAARDLILARIPLRRVGRPEEVAAVVRFLATEADYITGQTLNINGGIFIG